MKDNTSRRIPVYRRWERAQAAEWKGFQSFFRVAPKDRCRIVLETLPIALDFFEGKNVLEVGCSPLAMIHQIEKYCFKVAVDPLAHKYKNYYDLAVHHIRGIGESLPFSNETFDVIICDNTLNHVLNPKLTLEEIKRVLKEKGAFIFWVHTFPLPKTLRSILSYINRPHPYHFSDSDALQLLRETGFNVDYQYTKAIKISSAFSIMRSHLLHGLRILVTAILLCRTHELCCMCSKSARI